MLDPYVKYVIYMEKYGIPPMYNYLMNVFNVEILKIIYLLLGKLYFKY